MFEINPITKDIRLTQGNAGVVNTTPYIYETNTPIEFGENDIVIFTVTSPSGKVYIQKFLTQDNRNDDGSFDIHIKIEDTIKMCPFRYRYDIVYAQCITKDVEYSGYTYIDTAFFTVVEAQGLVNALLKPTDGEINNPTEDEETDVPVEDEEIDIPIEDTEEGEVDVSGE